MADKRLIPDGIRDSSTEAFNELIERLGTLDLTPLLIYIIDNVHASALPHLAWQFHIEGWELAETEEEKRALIKKAIELHRYKGTKWAVENAIKVLGIDAEVREWFEYGGQPYRFRVELGLNNRQITASLRDRLIAYIEAYKNERSWLEDIVLAYLSSARVFSAAGSMAECYGSSEMLQKIEQTVSGNIYPSAGSMAECYGYAVMEA